MTTIMEISGATDNINYTRPNDAGTERGTQGFGSSGK